MTRPARRSRAPLSLAALAAASLLALSACGGDGDGGGKPAGKEPEKAAGTRPKESPTYAIRHLLVTFDGAPAKIKKPRTKDEAKARATELSARLRADPKAFDAVAREASDDPTTAPDGGFFGFLSRETGEITALVEATEALAEGAVSQPVETQFGWHVLQRLSREEGKRVEDRVSAVVNGVIVLWEGLERGVPASQTKEVAYAVAAKAVHEARAGRKDALQAREDAPFTREIFDVFRTAPKPGFEALGQAAHALKVGEVSDPVETRGGWAVVRRQPYLRCYLRHIVVAHQVSLVKEPPPRTVDEAKALAQEARELVRDRSRWAEAVARYSDEPASKVQGGYMGDVTNAGISQRRVPMEMEAALHALAPDEISDVVESRLGFHVLWRVD
jgi:parvulin-like peptidyl-prolyl isomerase